MSSPIDRSFGADGVSPYAPKWARDLDNEPRPGSLRHRLQMAGRDYKDPPAMPPNLEVEHFQPPASLAPSLVPDPPIQESWLRESSRALAPGGNGGAFFSYLFAILLAALVAFVIVVELPNILSFMSKQRPATNSFGERFDGDGSRQPIRLAPKATEPQPVSVAHLDSPPPKADPPAEAVNRVATVPAADPSPVEPAQAAAPAPAPASQAPTIMRSANASSAPVMDLPPVAKLEPSAVPAVDTKVTTVPVQPDQPVRPLDRDDIETLLQQGKDFVSIGDFASARMVFRRVWEAKDAQGALALAATYDPIVLRRIDAKGASPDVAKAREWYIKARDLGSPDAAVRLKALADRGATSVASQDSIIPASNGAAITSAETEPPNAAMQSNPRRNETPAPPGSYWTQGESVMRLDAVGVSRKFFFYTPSNAELKAGAKPGSLRFDGQISGTGYTGTAFLYSAKCGRSAISVSGQIENNDGRVILSGRTPQLDADCREIGRVDRKLVFDLMKTPPK